MNETLIIDGLAENDLFDSVSTLASSSSSTLMNILAILIPIVSLFGVLTNSLNTAVFLNSKMKDPTFKYMLAISVSNLFYTGLLSYGYLSYCDDCQLSKAYSTQLYKVIVDYFFCSALTMFSILIEILMSIHRYFMLKNNVNCMGIMSYKWIMPLLFFVSVSIYVPVLFTFEVASIESSPANETYDKVPTEFGLKIFFRFIFYLEFSCLINFFCFI